MEGNLHIYFHDLCQIQILLTEIGVMGVVPSYYLILLLLFLGKYTSEQQF